MAKKRNAEIDLLRAVAILGMIGIHVLDRNRITPFDITVWNYLHFVVVSFVFCSGYVVGYSEKAVESFTGIIRYYKKRFIRLLLPYYIFLAVHFLLWFLFPNFFSGLGYYQKTVDFFLSSIFLYGGISINWLQLLFIELTLVTPFLFYCFRNKKVLYSYLLFAGIFTIWLTLQHYPQQHFRQIMLIPWSLVFILSLTFFKRDSAVSMVKIKPYLIFGIFSFFVFLIINFLLKMGGHPLILNGHKYPPDYYYLGYSAGISCFIVCLGKMKFFSKPLIQKSYTFISQKSYSLFFVHYVVLDAVVTNAKKINYLSINWVQYVVVVLVSLILLKIYDYSLKSKLSSLFIKNKHTNPPSKNATKAEGKTGKGESEISI